MGFFNRKPKDTNQLDWDTTSVYDSFWRSSFEFVSEIFKVVIVSLAVIIPIRYFLIQPFYVKGASMEPNFTDHQYLIIDELSYRLDTPQRGDVVVFRYPNDPRQYFIKRVIGLPGERIKIKDNTVYIFNEQNSDGVAINEYYLGEGEETTGNKDVTLSTDEFFVMGDNRDSSHDSRGFGPVPRRLIVGRVWLRGWPFDQIKVFDRPDYNL